jgi:phosphoenolpyruvate synthase/pyruvate phosphate dikinase
LGVLSRAGLPVPPGFVVTASACLAAMDTAELAAQVVDAYQQLGDDVPVVVRSSATSEDTAGASFAGMHETYANVIGADAVLDRLVACWTSLYGERVIAYRASRGFIAEPAIAVVVQVLVRSERAGVMFTADPSTGAAAVERVLSDDEVLELAALGKRVEAVYDGVPQDIEWVIEGGSTQLVQSRPITTLSGALVGASDVSVATVPTAASGKLLLQGLAASSGIGGGRHRRGWRHLPRGDRVARARRATCGRHPQRHHRAARRRRWRRASTSTWPWQSTRSRSRPAPSTVSGCCGRSS